MRLIDADKLIEIINETRDKFCDENSCSIETFERYGVFNYNKIIAVIEAIPAVEVHGRAKQPEVEERFENLGGMK